MPPEISGADTAWVLVSSALVMFMTPGLAFFYGGLVRAKNVLNMIMMSFVSLGIISVVWMLIGYSIGFDTGNDFFGYLDFFGLRNVGSDPAEIAGVTLTIPATAYMVFQMMFAVITPALISGAIAERMKFSSYVLFITAWSILVYSPVAHWVWGGGWLGLGKLDSLDFAGGTVVHINAGIAALAAIIYMGKRKGFGRDAMHPHNVPMVVSGAGILWLGWFGFNAGSALASGGLASAAFVNTHLGAAGALVGWLIAEWGRNKVPTTVGAATGAVAGLVAITPAAGYVEPWAAVVIGLISGIVCYAAVSLKPKIGYDDSLDVVGVHFVGGAVGALLTGLFATTKVHGLGEKYDGLFYGNPSQLGKQALAIAATIVYSFVVTMIILKIVDVLTGLRVTEEQEAQGLDLSQHAESAYTLVEVGQVRH